MEDSPPVTETPTPNPLPYATPTSEGESDKMKMLAMIVFFQCAAGVAIFFIGGASWPAVAALAILATVVIALAHFITRRSV